MGITHRFGVSLHTSERGRGRGEACSASTTIGLERGPRVERRIIERLQSHWQGPPIAVRVAEREYLLGSGQPASEVIIHRPALLRMLWLAPELTFGEAYMRGEIEVKGSLADLVEAYNSMQPAELSPWYARYVACVRYLPKAMSLRRAMANARHHYNIGNDFYKLWLDPSLTYSCAYFLRDTDDLAAAQRQKLELLCRKVRLAPGQTLLDIGCGWGSLLIHAARYYGVQVTGVTPAGDQADYIEALARREGLSERIRVLRTGWRQIDGKFDRIISVGMFEHVGVKQYREFFNRWRQLLADGGLSLLHAIGRMKPGPPSPWIDKYIFPGGYLPTLTQIAHYAAEADLSVLDVENLKRHYARTLQHWLTNFQSVIDQVVVLRGEAFARMWSLYLHGSEAGFRVGDLQLWQTVLAKDHQHAWPLNRELNSANSHVQVT